jgi:hypothetical protein
LKKEKSMQDLMVIRPLRVDDVFTVAGMLHKGTKAELAKAVKTDGSANPTELGLGFFLSLFVETREELKAWLADLIGITPEEFSSKPPAALLQVIDLLRAQEDFKDFLASVKELWSEMAVTL